MSKPYEFDNRFEQCGLQIHYANGEAVPTLAWVGMSRLRLFAKHITPEMALSGEHIEMYLDIAPGVMAFNQAGKRVPQILTEHTVRFSMN